MTKTEFIFAAMEFSNHRIGKKEIPVLFLSIGGGKLETMAKVLNQKITPIRHLAKRLTTKGYIWQVNAGKLGEDPMYLPTNKGNEVIQAIMKSAHKLNGKDDPR